MKEISIIGVDLAKNVFQPHGAAADGTVLFRKKLSRPQFQRFMAEHPPCLVVMEACSVAHHWALELELAGHEVRLIAPGYVKPFVKRQKNDSADAEAIVEAALRPTMRYVEPKAGDQQARSILFRTREQFVNLRTETISEQSRLGLRAKWARLNLFGRDCAMRRISIVSMCCGLVLAAPFAAAEEAPSVEGDWATAAVLPEERTEVSITTDGDRIYILGGFGQSPEGQAIAPSPVYAYDPNENRWLHISDLPEGVNHAGLAHVESSLYVIGGFRESSFDAIDDLRIYDLNRDSWRDGPPLPTARGALAVAVHEGRLHAIGGTDASGENSGAHEIFDPASETWTAAAALPMPRNHLGAASTDGEIVVLGGRDETSATLTHNHIYDIAAGEWREGAPIPTGRSGVAAVELDGYVYLFGGETFDPDSTFDDAERYHPASDRWEVLPPMPTPRHGLGAAALKGRIHVISGGPEAGFAFSDAHEVLDPHD